MENIDSFDKYNLLSDYMNSLNKSSGKKLLFFYDQIYNFNFIHPIPAVRSDCAVFLYMMSMIHKPSKILEIGFGSGVSSLFIRKPLKTIDYFISIEKDLKRFERGNILLQEFKSDIKLVNEDAINYLSKNKLQFDFIFMDAVKKDYQTYLDLITDNLVSGGILIADNTFYNSKVIQNSENSRDLKELNRIDSLKNFNKTLSESDAFETIFLDIGDGISLSVKK